MHLRSALKRTPAIYALFNIYSIPLFLPLFLPPFFATAQQMTKEFRPDPSEKRYTFDDVQGIEEAKDEVKELVEFLRNPEKFQRLGAKLPTGRWKNGY